MVVGGYYHIHVFINTEPWFQILFYFNYPAFFTVCSNKHYMEFNINRVYKKSTKIILDFEFNSSEHFHINHREVMSHIVANHILH